MNRRVLLAWGVLLMLGTATPRLAYATWSHDPYGNNPVFVSTSNFGSEPVSVSDGAGGIITVFYTSGSGYDLRIQRLDAQGNPMWGTNGVLFCTAAGDQIQYAMVPDGAGGAIVAWSDRRVAPGDMYAQRINASGVPQWTANGVAFCTAAGLQYAPEAISDGAGGIIVAWTDARPGATVDLYAQRINGSGVAQWAADGVGVCTAAGDQYYHELTSDGAGGALVTWHDNRGGTLDVYAARVTSSGSLPWTANGVAVAAVAAEQWFPKIAPDGSNGAFVAWTDRRGGGDDVYAQRLSSSGFAMWTANGVAVASGAGDQSLSSVLTDGVNGFFAAYSNSASGNQEMFMQRVNIGGAPYWAATGVTLCAAAGNQSGAALVPDGENGVLAVWSDTRTGQTDLYAGRITRDGVVLTPASGVAVCVAANNQVDLNLLSDDRGGAIAAWRDMRASQSQVRAQRIDHQVALGEPSPIIAFIRDVPNDQGGQLKVSWYASYLDLEMPYGVTEYWLLRSVPYNTVQTALAEGATLGREGPGLASRSGRRFLQSANATEIWFWELLDTQPAFHSQGYSLVAATTGDSIAGSNPYTVFMVRARNDATDQWWDSSPDSGYSVDDLSPTPPSAFSAQFFPGGAPPGTMQAAGPGYTWLHWNPNTEADFVEYRLHHGTSSDFMPEPANLLTAQPDTGYIDVNSTVGFYKLLAVDSHGNLSVAALLGPSDIVGVPGELPNHTWLAQAWPNPAQDATVLRFGLPRPTRVTIAVYDVSGRRVRDLARALLPAGEHSAQWDTRDAAGHAVASGLYLLRFESEGHARTQRIAVTR